MRPIAVALREDPLEPLLVHIQQLGGACNVVMPLLNGVVVVAFELAGPPSAAARESRSEPGTAAVLTTACTVGVFVERLRMDASVAGEAIYAFKVQRNRPSDEAVSGKAEVVALAG